MENFKKQEGEDVKLTRKYQLAFYKINENVNKIVQQTCSKSVEMKRHGRELAFQSLPVIVYLEWKWKWERDCKKKYIQQIQCDVNYSQTFLLVLVLLPIKCPSKKSELRSKSRELFQ